METVNLATVQFIAILAIVSCVLLTIIAGIFAVLSIKHSSLAKNCMDYTVKLLEKKTPQ